MNNRLKAIKEQAVEELDQERFEAAVEVEKERLRRHVPFWHKVFPFTITIRRRSWLIPKQQ